MSRQFNFDVHWSNRSGYITRHSNLPLLGYFETTAIV